MANPVDPNATPVDPNATPVSADQGLADLQAQSAETMRFQLGTMQIQQESSLVSSLVQSTNALANKTEQTIVR